MAVTWIAADPQAAQVITILNHSLFSRDHNVRASHWQNWDSQSTSGAMRFVCSIACTHQEQKHQIISRQKVFRASVQKHQPNHQGSQDSKLQCTVCPITLTISHWLAPKVASLHSRATCTLHSKLCQQQLLLKVLWGQQAIHKLSLWSCSCQGSR
jgi:hypothetical protein